MGEQRLYRVLGTILMAALLYATWSGFTPRLPIPWLQPPMAFVGRKGIHIVDLDSGEPLYVNGWNSYWLLSSGSPAAVSEIFRIGRKVGMSVCRIWAFSDGGDGALQLSPGRFDEGVFQMLDFIIYEARRNGIRLILCLVNNLKAFGGKAQYVRWAQDAGDNETFSEDSFFSSPVIKGFYKTYIKSILTRRNTYSGIKYSDEPAIFAWELMNEPRCVSNSSAPFLQAWISEISSYVKSLDSKHLVTVGLEGFYGLTRLERLGANPGPWAASLGSDFIQNSVIENIDFASVHAYPDSWLPNSSLEDKINYTSMWIDSHLNDSELVLRKPVLFSEVGFSQVGENGSLDGDTLLELVYDKVYSSAIEGRAGAGALLWQLTLEALKGYEDKFSIVAGENTSVFKLIKLQSCRLRNLLSKENITSFCSKFLP